MKRDEVFPSKYLKATDLNGKALCVTIERAPLEILKNPEGKEQSKTVLHFVKAKKMLPLNRVNWDSVADICGDDTEDWTGKKIELYPTMTEMAGKRVARMILEKLSIADVAALGVHELDGSGIEYRRCRYRV